MNKTLNVNSTFTDFYNNCPDELREILDKAKTTPQTFQWHPEVWVYDHIKVVFNRTKRTGDFDLMLAAFFHDLGKVFATKPHKSGDKTKWPSSGHAEISAKYVEKYKNWIEELGGNYDKIYMIVAEHMRIKDIDVMRPHKSQKLKDNKFYPNLQTFTSFDDMLKDYSKDMDD